MNVILIRHGHTQDSHEFRFTGLSDVPLSTRGRYQAKLTGLRLINADIMALYTSDVARAQETALICAAWIHVPVQICTGLREIDVGAWTGCTWEQVKTQFPEDLIAWQQDRLYHRRSGGESFVDAEHRVVASMKSLYKAHMSDTIALVCHVGTIRTALSGLGLYDRQEALLIPVAHCSFTTITIQRDSCELIELNHTDHLRACLVD